MLLNYFSREIYIEKAFRKNEMKSVRNVRIIEIKTFIIHFQKKKINSYVVKKFN